MGLLLLFKGDPPGTKTFQTQVVEVLSVAPSLTEPLRVVLDTGWKNPSSHLGGSGWTTPGNIYTSDNAYASVQPAVSTESNPLVGTNYGFSIPTGAVIKGIEARLEGQLGAFYGIGEYNYAFLHTNYAADYEPRSATSKGFTLSGVSEGTSTVGSSSDLWGGCDTDGDNDSDRLWTAADFNSANFGISFVGASAASPGATQYVIDTLELRVTYEVLTKVVGTSIVETETLSGSLSVEQALTLLATAIAEAETVTALLGRTRPLAFALAETETLAQTLARNRGIATSISETSVITAVLRKTTGLALTVSEVETLVATIGRTRAFNLTIAEAEALTAAFIRARAIQTVLSETETLSASLAKALQLAFSISEAEALAATISRTRQLSSGYTSSLAYTFNLGALRAFALSLVESETLTADLTVAVVKLLSATIVQSTTHSFGELRRVRGLLSAINEVSTLTATRLNRSLSLAVSLAETEDLDFVLGLLKQLALNLAEVEAVTAQLSRKRDIQLTINEVETLIANLERVKLLAAAVVEQTTHTFLLNRVRGLTFTLAEATTLGAAFARVRGLVTSIGETEVLAFDTTRLRGLLTTIAETEGLSAAFTRLRGFVADLAEVTGYTFTLSVLQGLFEGTATAVISWRQFAFIAPNEHRLTTFTETVSFAASEDVVVALSTAVAVEPVSLTQDAPVSVVISPSTTVTTKVGPTL